MIAKPTQIKAMLIRLIFKAPPQRTSALISPQCQYDGCQLPIRSPIIAHSTLDLGAVREAVAPQPKNSQASDKIG